MSDYTLICLVCGHGPHQNKACVVCECKHWTRPDVQAARALVNINNLLTDSIPAIQLMVMNLLDLLVAAYPEAVEKVNADRKAAQEEAERLKKEQETTNGEEEVLDPAAGADRGDDGPFYEDGGGGPQLGPRPISGPPGTED